MLARMKSLWRNLARRSNAEREMDEEMAFHLEARVSDLVRRGLSAEEARRRARIEFGGVEKYREAVREKRRVMWAESLAQDLQQGARKLWRSPGYTFLALISLVIGIGANTAICNLLYSLTLRSLPVRDGDRVVSIYQTYLRPHWRGVQGSPYYLSYPEFANYRDNSQAFSDLTAYAETTASVGGRDPESVTAQLVACNYFQVLGPRLTAGLGFDETNCREKAVSPVVVLGSAFAQQRFGAAAAAIGKTMVINNQLLTIIGVAAPEFAGTELQTPRLWIPIGMTPHFLPDTFGTTDWLALANVSWLHVLGHLKEGVSYRQARTELTLLSRRMDAGVPGRETRVTLNSGAFLNNPEVRGLGVWFGGGLFLLGGLILLMACANAANLMLARMAARQREIRTRYALGADRVRLVRQLLVENVLLAALGGAGGLLLAVWLPPALLQVFPDVPAVLPVSFRPNLAILLYAVMASLIAAGVSGLAPALRATRGEIMSSLREQASSGGHTSRMRAVLVATQVAGSAVLLLVATLLGHGLHRAEHVSPGFATDNVYVVSLDLAQKGYNAERAETFGRTLQERIRNLPGVLGVTRSAILPCVTGNMTGITLRGTKGERQATVLENIVSPEYFTTMEVPVLRGAGIRRAGENDPGPNTVVISQRMANEFWPGEDAIGKEFVTGKNQPHRVAGIVPDLQNLHLGQVDGPFFYESMDDNRTEGLEARVFVRVSSQPGAAATVIPALVHQLDASVLATVEPYQQILRRQIAPARTGAALASMLGLLAMFLAVAGVTGVVSFAASQRVREFGIRMSLGAQPREVVLLLLRQGCRPLLIGAGIGMLLGTGGAVLLSATDLLFGVSPFDPAAYVGVAVLLFVAGIISAYAPARRATRLDPAVVLRFE